MIYLFFVLSIATFLLSLTCTWFLLDIMIIYVIKSLVCLINHTRLDDVSEFLHLRWCHSGLLWQQMLLTWFWSLSVAARPPNTRTLQLHTLFWIGTTVKDLKIHCTSIIIHMSFYDLALPINKYSKLSSKQYSQLKVPLKSPKIDQHKR